jgi:hypothetical protein
MATLSLNEIRQLAEAAECWEEASFNERSRVLCFNHMDGKSKVTVYYTTMTIGTSLSHPVMGKTQLFRRNVTRTELIKIFANPRSHTGKGYYEVKEENKKRKLGGPGGSASSSSSSSAWVSPSSSPPPPSATLPLPDETEALKIYLKHLLCEIEATTNHIAEVSYKKRKEDVMAEIEAEKRVAERMAEEQRAAEAARVVRERMMAEHQERMRVGVQREAQREATEAAEATERLRVEGIERERREEEEKEEREDRARIAARNRKRGQYRDYSLTYAENMPGYMDDTKCVAIGEGGYIAVNDRSCSHYHGIPDKLIAELKKAQNANISYVAIGPQYYDTYEQEWKFQYLLVKNNGRTYYNVHPDFSTALEENQSPPKLVAFGPYGTYYVKFEDGREDWGGALSDKVLQLFRETHIVCVAGRERGLIFCGVRGTWRVQEVVPQSAP